MNNVEKVKEILINMIPDLEKKTGVKFNNCEFRIDGRLTKSLGRTRANVYRDKCGKITRVKPTSIVLNKHYVENGNIEDIKRTFKHEFAHYVTFKKKGQHNHDTVEFITICELLNTTYTKINPNVKHVTRKYEGYCSKCGKRVYGTDRATNVTKNPNRYISGCCNAHIEIKKNY